MSALSLAEAKAHLNITAATYDDELQAFIETAENVIAERVGPLEPTMVTDRVAGGYRGTVVLAVAPVIAVTSVTSSYGDAVDVSSLDVTEAGVLTYADGMARFGGAIYSITYEAGRSTLPPALLMAVKEMLRHLWKSQRGGAQRPGSAADTPAPGYLVPYMVAEMIEPYRMNFGVC